MGTNELAGGDRTNLILSRRFDIQGAPAPFMASEIFPQIVLENDRPEYEWLGLGRLCSAPSFIAAAVGNFGVCGLINPAGTGTLAVLKSFTVWNNTTGGTQSGFLGILGANQNGLSLSDPGFLRDSRGGFAAGRRSTLRTIAAISATVPVEGRIDEFLVPDDGSYTGSAPVVLAPNSCLYAAWEVQNVDMWVIWRWTERAAEQSELLGAFGQ